jgi:hypothetical protein
MPRSNYWVGIFVVGAIITVITIYSSTRTPLREAEHPFAGRIGPLEIYPNATRTPGAINADITQGNMHENICNPAWSTRLVRPPSSYTNRLKAEQLRNYGYADTNPRDYEEDHLIPLEIGGSPTDPSNLWPEPYEASIPDGGARAKDEVENYLHKQVCTGTIPLQTAQREIATDWYRVYIASVKKSF